MRRHDAGTAERTADDAMAGVRPLPSVAGGRVKPRPEKMRSQSGRSAGGILSAAAALGGCTVLSRLLGLARDAATAWLLGAGPVADALTAAMRLPHILRRMLAEGSLSMSLTARFAGRGDAEETAAAVRALAWRLGAVLLAACAAAAVLAAPFMRLLAPGLDAASAEFAGQLLRACLPYVPAAGMAALCMAVLHARERFLVPALSPVLSNICVLTAAVLAVGCGADATRTAFALALGMSCGGCAQWLLQQVAVARLLRRPRRRAGRTIARSSLPSREAWRLLIQLPAGALAASAPQLAMLAAMWPASLAGEGNMAALYYAERLLELPIGLVGACLGMAALPHLTRLARADRWRDFALLRDASLRWAIRLSLPAATGLAAVSGPLVDCLLGHGAFDANAVRLTALAVLAYVPCLPACAVSRCLLASCHAAGRRRQAALTGLLTPLLTLVAGLLLIRGLDAPVRGAGAAAAASLALWVQTGLLWRMGRDAAASGDARRWALRFCCSQVGVAALVGLAAGATSLLAGALPSWGRLGLSVAAGLLIWPPALLLVRDRDICRLGRRLLRRNDDSRASL